MLASLEVVARRSRGVLRALSSAPPVVDAAELMFRPALELAELVRRGEVSARELVEASLERIHELNPAINAFVDVDREGARAAGDAIGPGDERPFAGVPIAIKSNRAMRGCRQPMGAELMGDYVPDYDHNVIRRLREAGFVIVGSTAMPEWGILPTTEPRRFGPTRNPWDRSRTAGGSSGGSAAAVAAGMVPIAHGNDGGGSLRIPAACCGLIGLKAQRGRISHAPEAGQSFLSQDGVLSRTVADTAAALDVLAGPETGDASWAPPPAEAFARGAAREPTALRIGMTTLTPFAGITPDRACVDAVHDAAGLLEGLGHDVEEVQPPWQREGLLELFTAAFGTGVAISIAFAARRAKQVPRETDMEAVSWMIWQGATRLDAMTAVLAERKLEGYARRIARWATPYDVLITPALAEPPVPLGTLDPDGPDPQATYERSSRFTPYAAVSNVTGSPAISVPLYQDEGGLPLAVQLIGRPAQEGALLSLAGQLERAKPWLSRRPGPPPSAGA